MTAAVPTLFSWLRIETGKYRLNSSSLNDVEASK